MLSLNVPTYVPYVGRRDAGPEALFYVFQKKYCGEQKAFPSTAYVKLHPMTFGHTIKLSIGIFVLAITPAWTKENLQVLLPVSDCLAIGSAKQSLVCISLFRLQSDGYASGADLHGTTDM